MLDMDVNVSSIDGEEGELLRIKFDRTFSRFNGYVMFDELKECMDSILNMNIRDDDIWVCSFPKTGTTWTQEMVYLVANDGDISKAKKPLKDRCVYLDTCYSTPKKMVNYNEHDISEVKKMLTSNGSSKLDQRPRFIFTHLPFELLPRQLTDGSANAKIVYVVRNPRDTCISGFHMIRGVHKFEDNLKNYSEMFMKGLVGRGPFWKHVFGYWNRRNDKNVLFIKFEDMKKDLPSMLKKIATFLEKSLTDEQIGPMCEHLSFESMKINASRYEKSLISLFKNQLNPDEESEFFRTGKSGQWKNEFEPELIDRFEQWECANLKHLNLKSYSDL